MTAEQRGSAAGDEVAAATALRARAGVGATPPAPDRDQPIERDLARGALKVIAVLALPVLVVTWLVADTAGLLGGALAVAVVAAMYAGSGALLSWAARRGPEWLMGAALAGFGLRLLVYLGLMVLLRPLEVLHGPSLAISAAVLLIASLAWEVRTVQRTPALWWLTSAAGAPRPAATKGPDA